MHEAGGFLELVAELAQHERRTLSPLPDPAMPSLDQLPRRHAVQLLAEILNAAPMIATCTSIANALEKPSPRVERQSIAVFAPVERAYFQTLLEQLLASEAPLDVCAAVQDYHTRLSLAVRMSNTSASLTGTASMGVDIEILADCWRRTAHAAMDAIAAIDRVVGSRNSHCVTRPATALLSAAEAGGEPCLEPDGRVTIPGYAERRRDVRRPLQLAATVQIGHRSMPVMICDASRSGLGLQCNNDARQGDPIMLRRPNERPLSGVVAWATETRIGVRLSQPLETTDPLLTG